MKKISTFIILSAVFVLCTSMSGCEDSSYRVFKVTIENESDDSIYYVTKVSQVMAHLHNLT